MPARIPIDRERIAAFCRKWRVTEFALFGSVLRDDFGPDSDVDVMVSFAGDTRWSLLDLVRMEEELHALFGRRVDLLTRGSVTRMENPLRRRNILGSLEPLHVAG